MVVRAKKSGTFRFVSVIIIYDGSPTATKNLTEL